MSSPRKGHTGRLIVFILLAVLFSPLPASAQDRHSVYDRVMKSGTIRCGYFSWYPDIIKDPVTGAFKGIVYEWMNEIGKSLNLKIDWAEEVSLGDYTAALESGRIDAMCGGAWMIAERARVIDYVTPVYYLPLYAYARADDNRFDKNIDILNGPEYRMVVLEGGVTSIIRRHMFPKSQGIELPQMTSPSELFLNLAQQKADVAIYDPLTFHDYDSHNPGKLKQISTAPVKVFPHTVAVMRGQEEFRRMLDHATTELMLTGTIDKIITRHEKYPGTIMRVTKPYEISR